MEVVFFHNEHDKECVNLLQECINIFPTLTIVPFMEARNRYWFRGCPGIWIGKGEEYLWQNEVDLTIQDFQDALSTYRELKIEGATETIVGSHVYTILAYDPYGNPVDIPEVMIEIGDVTISVNASDPSVEINFAGPGTYLIRATAPNHSSDTIEVVVNAL